jgi:hypothetical protein
MTIPEEVEEAVTAVMEAVVGMAEVVEAEEGMEGLSRHQQTPLSTKQSNPTPNTRPVRLPYGVTEK